MPSVLVIDDEPNIRYSLDKCLRSEMIQVTTASTARQGIDLALISTPILDLTIFPQGSLNSSAFSRLSSGWR
jgi:CheY-like chemotaxis protein